MTFHTFECEYPLSGSDFATLHRELKKLGSSYFESKPKMADKIKKICLYCIITIWDYNLHHIKRNNTINICTHANL